jgi:hypothetical protein
VLPHELRSPSPRPLGAIPRRELTCGIVRADLFQPVGDVPVQGFLNCDMGHCCGGCGAMPVLLTRCR